MRLEAEQANRKTTLVHHGEEAEQCGITPTTDFFSNDDAFLEVYLKNEKRMHTLCCISGQRDGVMFLFAAGSALAFLLTIKLIA